MNNEWMSIKDGLPYELEEVLVTTYDRQIHIGYRNDKRWFLEGAIIWTSEENIIAWMRLPEFYSGE